MAWGVGCSDWDDSVDWANIEKFTPDEIPPDEFIMTSWHENESLEEVLRFAKFDATLSFTDEPLKNLLVLDFAAEGEEQRIAKFFGETA